MKKSQKTLLAVSGLLLALTACTPSEADDDRKGSGGNQPDKVADTTNVVIHRNADNVPNVAYFCSGPLGWASTLSGTDSGGSKAASLVRLEAYDEVCAGDVSMETFLSSAAAAKTDGEPELR